jgi:hypothetical protein
MNKDTSQTAGRHHHRGRAISYLGVPRLASVSPIVTSSGPVPVYKSGVPLSPRLYRVPGVSQLIAPTVPELGLAPAMPELSPVIPRLGAMSPIMSPVMSPVSPLRAVIPPPSIGVPPPVAVMSPVVVPSGIVTYRVRSRAPFFSLFIIANGQFVFFRNESEIAYHAFMYRLNSNSPLSSEVDVKNTFNSLMSSRTGITLDKDTLPTRTFTVPRTASDVYYYAIEEPVVKKEGVVLTLSPEELLTTNLIDEHSRVLARAVWEQLLRERNRERAFVGRP